MAARSPSIVLYTRPGCGLCAETRAILEELLAERASDRRPILSIVERDIESNPDWERQFMLEIPVVEIGERRYSIATSPARLRRFLDGALDAVIA